MNTLKRCPFCDGCAYAFEETTGHGHGESYDKVGIRCTDCKAEISILDYSGNNHMQRNLDTIAMWNRRASDE